MKNLVCLFMFLLVQSLSIFAQTSNIYAKRHGGTVYNSELDMVRSNLGVGPERWVRNSKLTRVELINDSVAVMFTENYCEETYSRASQKWAPGVDTVTKHPVFTSGLTIEEMERKLDNDYYFENEASRVKFVGYEEKEKGKEKIASIPVPIKDNGPKVEDKPRKKHFPGGEWLILLVLLSTTAGAFRLR